MGKSGSNNLLAIALVGLFLLLGFNAYQWYQLRNVKTELANTKSSLLENEKLQAELEQDYQSALSNLEELRGTNTELNTMIDQQKAELTEQKKKVSNLIWTKGELNTVREELELFKSQAASYASQIRDLKSKNASLTSDNQMLTSAKVALEGEVASQGQRIQDLDEQTNLLTEVKTRIENENTQLSSKVDMAEAIKINFISVDGFKERNGKEAKQTSRAKNVAFLQTCFKTESNYVVQPGDETFYVRLISPTGETMFDEQLGSGTLTNKLDGSDVRYTTAGDITYNNADAEGCISWDPNYALGAGNYGVELFNKGYLVGKGNFLLK